MPSPAPALALSASQKAELEGLVRSGNTPQKVALRCRLLLLAHQGVANQCIAEQLDLSRPTIVALREAFARDGLAAVTGIRKRQRRGSVLTPELEQKIIDTTIKTRPGDGSTHWSVRMLANSCVSPELSFTGSGSVTMCSHIVWRSSNYPTIRTLKKRSGTSLACI